MNHFKIVSDFRESRDQVRAVKSLAEGLTGKEKFQTLLGVTGSGKTYTMAKVIERVQKPALVLTHNKTLAAQLYREFKEFFPDNAVEYFVSYYDYYQPEAYVVSQDLYIEKDASINDEIDRLRLKATSSILDRDDVIVVSSVSCIYGLGSPVKFEQMHVAAARGRRDGPRRAPQQLVTIHYERNNISFMRGDLPRHAATRWRSIPPTSNRTPCASSSSATRSRASPVINPVTGARAAERRHCYIYPAKHFVSLPGGNEGDDETDRGGAQPAARGIQEGGEAPGGPAAGDAAPATTWRCCWRWATARGIENYSRIISRRKAGERPACLLDYFKGDYRHVHRRVPRHDTPGAAACTRATGRAR